TQRPRLPQQRPMDRPLGKSESGPMNARQQFIGQGLKARNLIARGEAPGTAFGKLQSPVRATQNCAPFNSNISSAQKIRPAHRWIKPAAILLPKLQQSTSLSSGERAGVRGKGAQKRNTISILLSTFAHNNSMKHFTLISLATSLALQLAAAQDKPLAFTGAEGFGQFATGGRGGETVHVTTLDDSGPGSFRDAVSKPKRTVVFDVDGTIQLKSNVAVSSDITLSGDTAPGDGITLYGRSTSFSGQNNVIVRYLRFREGINGDKGKCSVNLSSGNNMIFDHCSIEWGRWDCLGLTQGSHDITFQNCIIGEGVDPQRFGSLSDSVTNITYSHNLWINNQSRNPKAKGRIQY